MEREIKFEVCIKHKKTGNLWIEKFTIDDLLNINGSLYHSGIQEVVYKRQYTGLKDKNGNGNDVFEGDIFEAIYKDCPDGFTILGKETTIITVKAVVVFKFGKFVIEMMHPQYKELVYSDLFEFLKNEQKVVIGNIYENT